MKTIRAFRVEYFKEGPGPKLKSLVFDGRDWAIAEMLQLERTEGISCIRLIEGDHQVPDDFAAETRRVPQAVLERV